MRESLRHIQADMKKRGSKLKLVEVTTGTENQAQEFYRLGRKVLAVSAKQNLGKSDLLEATKLDGCNDSQFVWHIVVPLSKAITAVLVLFYTDGLTESQGSATRPVGEEGLAELLRQEIMDTSMDLPKRLYDRVLAFTGEDSLDDDALVLSLLRRRPDSGDTLSVDALRELVSW